MWEFKIGPLAFSFKNGYVKKSDCHEAHEKLEASLDDRFKGLKEHVDARIDDLKTAINNYIGLLK